MFESKINELSVALFLRQRHQVSVKTMILIGCQYFPFGLVFRQLVSTY